MEWLKEHLGEELYAQVAEKLKGSDKIKLANIASGEYVAKAKYEEEARKYETLKSQLNERDAQLETLRKNAGDNEALQAQIKELQTANETAAKDYAAKLAEQERDYALKDVLKNTYKARDVLSVLPHLKQDAIVYKDGQFGGLKEQMEALSKDKAFLFEGEKPAGTGAPFTPPAGEPSAWDFGFTPVRDNK